MYFACIYSCFNKFLKLKKFGVLFFNFAEYIVSLAYRIIIEIRQLLWISPVMMLFSVKV